MDLKTCKKRKAARCPPELMEELVLEILLRLPVNSLLRFKSVSKAWSAIISDPAFVRSHLERQEPSWLITPHTLDSIVEGEEWPTTFSTQIRFYRWQLESGVPDPRPMHATDFPGEFSSVSLFAHCDSLVLVPTNTKLYLINPATRETMTLPESRRNKTQYRHVFLPVGFGLDRRTGKYKVARAFIRFKDHLTEGYHMGMEVFTVGEAASSSWRETTTDLPYSIVEWITGKYVNGGLFWPIDRFHREHDPNGRGIVRFGLEDETFSVVRLPDVLSLDSALHESFLLDVMQDGGELCLTGFARSRVEVGIWMLVEDDATVGSRWERRYSLCISGLVQPMSLLPGGAIMVRAGPNFYCYELQATNPKLMKVCALGGLRYERRRGHATRENVFLFNVMPYMESLVRIVS